MTNLEEEFSKLKEIPLDLLIIGAGGAGLRAGIEASQDPELNIGIVSKTLLGKAHTVMAEGGSAAALGNADDRDSWQVHFRDTWKGTYYHGRWELAKILVQEGPERILELERWGAMFDRTEDGKILQRNFGGHAYPRLAHVGDRTGLEIIRILQETVIHCKNVEMFMEYTITRLLVKDGTLIGAFGYNRTSGELVLFKTKSVIMAAGGLGKIFMVTSNSWECTGSGFALAFDAGAELIDLEFVQIHPTGMAAPPNVAGTLVTEGVRGEGGILKNSEGERFMFNYIPQKFKKDYADTEKEALDWVFERDPNARKPPELLTRDVVSAAIRAEVKAGRGSPNRAAYLDIASIRDPAYIKKKLPSMYHQYKTLADIDITKDAFEVAPTAHYAMGGLKHEPEDSMTNIKGLFTAGEVAAGLHGANRLGGNALTDLLVFGKRAGEFACKYAKSVSHADIPEDMIKDALAYTLSPYNIEGDENPFEIHEELRHMMDDKYGESSESSLNSALEDLEKLSERAEKCKVEGSRTYNTAWHQALDIKELILVAKMISKTSIMRKESRGGHTRLDFQETDPKLQDLTYVIQKGSKGEIEFKEEKLYKPPEDLLKILEDLDEVYEFRG